MKNGLYDFCVSTILNKGDLDMFFRDGVGKFTENRPWKTAAALQADARSIGARFPVILSDAARDCATLLYWAVVEQIRVRDDNKTELQLSGFRKITKHKRQELILRDTGKPIASHFIRPYAICHTPDFLK